MFRRTPDPGTYKEIYCCICGTKCTVERDRLGARGFAQAMSGGKSPYDLFLCPNNGAEWHERVEVLMGEAVEFASDKLSEVVRQEAEELLGLHVPGAAVTLTVNDGKYGRSKSWGTVIDGRVLSPYKIDGEKN